MSNLLYRLGAWLRGNSVSNIGLPPNKDLRDPNQAEPRYTGPKLVVKPLIKDRNEN